MKKLITTAILAAAAIAAGAAENIEYDAYVRVNASKDRFAPYMIGSWNSGRASAGRGI